MRSRYRWVLPALAFAAASACSTSPKEAGLTLVQSELPPPSLEEVEEAQRILGAKGLYEGAIDGALSPETRIALLRFQRSAGLPESGTLDPATWNALQREAPPPAQEGAPPPPAPTLPSAEELLAEEPALPQPPPGALAEALAEATALLREAGAEGGPQEAPTPEEEARGLQRRRAELFRTEADAFLLLLEARRAGGYALLPEPLAEALKAAPVERGLLLRPSAHGLGKEEEAAIRWVQRSLGQEETGEPSLALLEALGVDPSPMFVG